MHIKNRLFPYPVMHQNILESSFKQGTFDLNIVTEKDDYDYIITISNKIGNEYIQRLIDNGKAEMVCIVECPQAMYRQSFILDEKVKIMVF